MLQRGGHKPRGDSLVGAVINHPPTQTLNRLNTASESYESYECATHSLNTTILDNIRYFDQTLPELCRHYAHVHKRLYNNRRPKSRDHRSLIVTIYYYTALIESAVLNIVIRTTNVLYLMLIAELTACIIIEKNYSLKLKYKHIIRNYFQSCLCDYVGRVSLWIL